MISFKNPNDPDNHLIRQKIQEWMLEVHQLSADTQIQVQEMNCTDPGCLDKETAIYLFHNDSTVKRYRIHKPLVYVRKPDIKALKII